MPGNAGFDAFFRLFELRLAGIKPQVGDVKERLSAEPLSSGRHRSDRSRRVAHRAALVSNKLADYRSRYDNDSAFRSRATRHRCSRKPRYFRRFLAVLLILPECCVF